MNIRLATGHDLPGLLELFHEVSDAMIGTPHDCCWRRDIHPSDEFIARLVREGGMLLAVDGAAVVGAAGIDHDLGHDYGPLPWLVDVPDELVEVIHILTVRPDRRGEGLSRALLRACLDEGRARGLRTARLDVTANNSPAFALYESEGFVTVGSGLQEIGPDDGHPFVELFVMELPL